MYTVVSNDKRTPLDLVNFKYEQLTPNEFIDAAQTEFTVDEGIYYDVACLSEEIYENLHSFTEMDPTIKIIYYQFNDVNVNLDFEIEEGIRLYEVAQPTPPAQSRKQQSRQQQQAAPVEEDENDYDNYDDEPEDDYQQPVQPSYSQPQQQKSNRGVTILETDPNVGQNSIYTQHIDELFNDDLTLNGKQSKEPARVILFGSSKGGTGKTFTCLLTAYRYAKTHLNQKIAVADFDIIDGQIGITLNKVTPTVGDFYKVWQAGKKSFSYLDNCKVKSDRFSPNIDFYLAPPQDIPEVTNNNEFWYTIFDMLIKNYDVVFFDSGIDYLGKTPISNLYKIADKIIITSNTSINSVKSVIKQLKTLNGDRKNNVFKADMDILDKVNIVLTRVSNSVEINQIVVSNLSKYAPICAAFGSIDDAIMQTQYTQEWTIWDTMTDVNKYLDIIASE